MYIILKSCKRCSGDRYFERDDQGPYITCLACGDVTYPRDETAATPEESALSGRWQSMIQDARITLAGIKMARSAKQEQRPATTPALVK